MTVKKRKYTHKTSNQKLTKSIPKRSGTHPVLRWFGRILSVLGLILLSFYSIMADLNPMTLPPIEKCMFLFLPLGIGLGYLISWKAEKTGALISLLSLLAFLTILYSQSRSFDYFTLDHLLFSIPAIFFLCASRK